jgi:hypothetical protein
MSRADFCPLLLVRKLNIAFGAEHQMDPHFPLPETKSLVKRHDSGLDLLAEIKASSMVFV